MQQFQKLSMIRSKSNKSICIASETEVCKILIRNSDSMIHVQHLCYTAHNLLQITVYSTVLPLRCYRKVLDFIHDIKTVIYIKTLGLEDYKSKLTHSHK